MKKITLFLVAALFSALSFAALNPYAYGLSSTLDGTTLTVNYSLNSAATGVSVVIMDGAEEVKTVTCNDKISKGSHSVEISTLDLPTGKSLTWKVVVTGNSVASPTLHDESIRFYLPYGLDCDVDPESDYLGNWYVIEATNGGQSKSGYQSNPFGRGLYAFDAALNPILNSAGTRGFTGGINVGATETNVNGDYINFYRVATSGGRVFIGRFRDGESYHPIVEANPKNLNETFTSVVTSGRAVSIDARGSGEDLKLVMLDLDYNMYEYDLGTAKSIAAPSRTIDRGTLNIVRNDATIAYDNEGGIWLNQNRSTATETCPTIAHISLDNGFDYNNISDGIAHNNTNNGGIAVSPDGKKLAVVGADSKKLTIYNISKVDGQIKLTQANVITVSAGNNHTALAFDYAGNLFAANRSSERIRIFAMPYSGTIATPCASKYAFEVEEIVANVYTLTTNVVGEGTVEGNAGSYVEGATATLTATPAAHYDFLNWTYGSETSTDNPLTITVNSDLTVTANFQEHTKYTITASAANNAMGYVTGGGTYYVGETVTLKAVANSTYYFVNWSDGNTDATRTFTATADVTLTANFAKASSRAWAYDLKMVEDGDNYKFSFNATTAANTTLLFLDKEGNELYTAHKVGTVAAGANTVSIEKAYFTRVKDVYWSVKMDGDAITSVAEITDPTRGIYDFYNMMGVLVDNDPNSNEFGKIYIQASINGASDGATARSDAQKAGLFIYDQGLNELNPTSNVGIAPTVPSGYEWGAAYQFHRLAVDPKTSNLVYSYAIESKPAVFSMDRANLTGTPTNLIAGIDGFTRIVAHCFDAEGTLYVMDLASSKGTIYKIKDGVKTVFVAATGLFVNQYISMAADGRGGLWVSHNRGQIDGYYQLAHVTSAGAIDWYVNQTSTHGFTGSATRGALAYDAERHILAQGRNSTVEVFQVAYDATTGVPTLTKIATTPQVNKANIDALAFDYAGDLYVCNSGTEKFYKYTLPTADNICTVPAPKSQFIEKEQKYTVTVEASPAEGGEVSGGGEAVEGAQVTISANANTGYRFVNWTKGSDEVSTDASFSYTVPAENVTLIANFEEILYTLIAPTNDENKGTVTGAGTYSYGTEVTLTATPKDGYKLLYWSDRSTENPRTITMTKNEALSAYFVKKYDEEPTFTITKLWENTNVPASTNNGFQAIGWDQKIYMKDRGNKQILVFSDATTSATYVATDDKDDQPIAIDDAGNIIIRSGSGFFYNAPTQVTIYKNGNKTGKVIDFTLPASGRCDFISASGDIYSAEGGYVYFYCQNQTTVSRLYIKNGGASAADVSVDKLDNATLTAGSSQSHVFTNIFGDLMTHTRDNNYKVLQEVNVLTGAVSTMNLPNFKKSTLGGCSFELGGKELIAYNIAGTDYNSEWNIYNMTDKQFLSNETLYAKDKVSRKNSGASNWLNVQVVDENTAYIYQFCPEVAVAVWKVSLVRNDLVNFTITATANNALMGSIVGSGEYYEGGTAMLTANANPGFRFVNWTKEGVEVSTDATYLFTVTEDVELVANFEVILLDTENNAGILTNLNDQTVDVAVYRSLTAGMYNTLCLPFDVDDILGTPLENTTVWQYNGAEVKGEGDSKEIFLEFTDVTSLKAGQPYLVEPAAEIEAPMVFNGVTISAIKGSEVAQSAVTMHGILHPTELEANNKSKLFLVENNNLAWANVTAYMNGMRAYFQVNEPSLQSARTRAYIRKAPTVATDMENITTTDTEIKKVIYNNTLYIIRGNEVYTVQGTKVK